jgi:3-octaprenyl-4-hydroxybenzoate carboxy-lyase
MVETALSYRRERMVVAVDEDIDLFDERSVPWAISIRVQWHRDTIEVDSLSHGNLDPSLPRGVSREYRSTTGSVFRFRARGKQLDGRSFEGFARHYIEGCGSNIRASTAAFRPRIWNVFRSRSSTVTSTSGSRGRFCHLAGHQPLELGIATLTSGRGRRLRATSSQPNAWTEKFQWAVVPIGEGSPCGLRADAVEAGVGAESRP